MLYTTWLGKCYNLWASIFKVKLMKIQISLNSMMFKIDSILLSYHSTKELECDCFATYCTFDD
jgi:hypothetical protein